MSKAVSFEAPFIFLLFGNERAVLLDTGPSADPAKVPLRRTVDELVGAWLAEHPREDYELVVAHTHGHHDHRDGFTPRSTQTSCRAWNAWSSSRRSAARRARVSAPVAHPKHR